MDSIKINENLMRRIVRSIDKAISDDVPQYLRENRKETNNYVRDFRGDCINDNLRNLVIGGDIEFVPFKRHSWEGRMIIDRACKITYTITTQTTLKAVPKKQRNKPHFLQSILYKENGDCEALVKQMTLIDLFPFEEDILEYDYNTIVGDLIDPTEGYRHYIVAYEATNGELRDIQLEFLDKEFNLIAAASLNEYIKPDFARLTDVEPVDEDYSDEIQENSKSLLSVKPGLRPKLRESEKQA